MYMSLPPDTFETVCPNGNRGSIFRETLEQPGLNRPIDNLALLGERAIDSTHSTYQQDGRTEQFTELLHGANLLQSHFD